MSIYCTVVTSAGIKAGCTFECKPVSTYLLLSTSHPIPLRESNSGLWPESISTECFPFTEIKTPVLPPPPDTRVAGCNSSRITEQLDSLAAVYLSNRIPELHDTPSSRIPEQQANRRIPEQQFIWVVGYLTCRTPEEQDTWGVGYPGEQDTQTEICQSSWTPE